MMRGRRDAAPRSGKTRVVIAMSGGVDSSAAASMLVEAGYDVVGIALKLWEYSPEEEDLLSSCCSPDDLYDARRVADALDIPFYVSNARDTFTTNVVDRFTQAYLNGVTPNPCIRCNSDVKFARLLKLAAGLEADYLATGHYARVSHDDDGISRLHQAADGGKDQSYFLFNLHQGELKRLLFPLGAMSKDEVREYARERGLPTASKHESMEICFVGNRKYARFVEGRVTAEERPPAGDIVDTEGRLLGRHKGIHHYTIGQRRGLGLPGGHAPMYVIAIKGDRVVVGPEAELWLDTIEAVGVSWTSGSPPPAGRSLEVRVRHQGERTPAYIAGQEGATTLIRLLKPQRAISPGQAVVMYDESQVLGGGWIKRSSRDVAAGTLASDLGTAQASAEEMPLGDRACGSR